MPTSTKTEAKYIDSDSDSVSDNESIHNSSDNEETIQVDNTPPKNKKQQITFIELQSNKEELVKEKEELLDIINDKQKEICKNLAQLKKLNRKIRSINDTSKKVYLRDIKSARKEKRKRNKPNRGGFNREEEIPKVLIEYFGDLLDEGVTKLARTRVCSLLHASLKRDGCKTGQQSIITKKVAKKLGVKKGKVIEFGQHQPFLASFYSK
tara:strand:- start:1077 stop:1703 length:627 start_codon:yes stop_codon:yes gene_type:complete